MEKVYDVSTIGGRLRKLRKDASYSQEELAARLHLSQHALSKYENNKLNMSLDIIMAVSKVFNTTPTYLLCGEKDDEVWLEELTVVARNIKDPKVREVALKQLRVLAAFE